MEIELLYDVFQEEIPIPIAPYGDDIENQQIKVKIFRIRLKFPKPKHLVKVKKSLLT